MTFVSSFPIRLPQMQQCLHPPRSLEAHDVSLIVPVRNNQRGLNALLDSIMQIQDPSCVPAEILVVDNDSDPPVQISSLYQRSLPLTLLLCRKRGPACARNMGAWHASGCWLWFCDSDCIVTEQSLKGYQQALNGAVGYAGWIRATRHNVICQYYEDQHILIPADISREPDVRRPAYVITANALVYQPAFQAIGGFREIFPFAAGEDIDFGVRLWSVGALSYATDAVVLHDFQPDLVSFLGRFLRYGRGNQRLSKVYDVDFTPRRFIPQHKNNVFHWTLAQLQWVALRIGYTLERGYSPS